MVRRTPSHVLLERDEVADGSRSQRREEPDVRERVRRAGARVSRQGRGIVEAGIDDVAHRPPTRERVDDVVHDDSDTRFAGVTGGEGRQLHEQSTQTGGATKQPRSGSLNDFLATNSFIGFAVPHWSETIGSVKS